MKTLGVLAGCLAAVGLLSFSSRRSGSHAECDCHKTGVAACAPCAKEMGSREAHLRSMYERGEISKDQYDLGNLMLDRHAQLPR